jgi:phosphonate transport system substrate-binding protein
MRVTDMLKSTLKSVAIGVALLGLFTAPSFADWRKDLGTFRIGIIEGEASKMSPGEVDRIRAAYADALGMPVEVIRPRDFPALIDAQASSRIEYAIYSAAAYATASLACECVEPLVRPVAADKSSGTRSILVLDEKVSVGQISSGKGIAVPGMNSISGLGVPLVEAQSVFGPFTGNEKWLRFAKDANAAVEAFNNNNIDGFIATVPDSRTKNTALQAESSLAKALAVSSRPVKLAWISNPLLNGPHAVRKNLANEAKNILAKFLLSLNSTDPDLNDLLLPSNDVAFVQAKQSDYLLAIAATKKLAAQGGQPAQ